MKKFKGLYRYLTERSVILPDHVIPPPMAEHAYLLTTHSKRYTYGIWDGTLSRKEERRMGLPWSKSLAIRSRHAVQGTINASLMALEDGISGNLAGGTHHAMPDHGEGFCVFNDVAVAINVLRSSMWIRRALVIDCDVHQGNGTAHIFSNDPDVYTFSIHGAKNYPFYKPPSNLDVPLEDGTGDAEYLYALTDALNKIFTDFEPDLVFYLGGIDPLETDHFGRLSLTLKGLRERERTVIEKVTAHSVPLVLLLSGGYAPTLSDTVMAHAQMFEVAHELGY
jgi:acetoin utilization deacetylase AcuC-like enzyme